MPKDSENDPHDDSSLYGPQSQPPYVVGVGASAGGLEALEQFFTAMPENSGFAFVVVQHLSPDFKSVMDELLARYTAMPVHLVEEGVTIEGNTVYLIPPKKEMVMSDGKLLLTDKDPTKSLSLPIDVFFRSLAMDCEDRAIAVVLSGTGSDGSRGIVDVKDAGGFVLAQSSETAKFDGMPKSAVDTGVVDKILAPELIPEAILVHARSPLLGDLDPSFTHERILENDQNTVIFKRLREVFNIDFAYYKPSTVNRRIERRMQYHKAGSLDEYAAILLDDVNEVTSLYKDLLIGVTKFFRDPDAFEVLEKRVIPQTLENAPANSTIRVWIPGCATGEEAYTMAFLFQEYLATMDSEKNLEVKIFATDLHKESITFAATGQYTRDSLEFVTDERIRRFFMPVGDKFQVSAEIRRMIVFAEQNLIKDPPFTKIDLVSCRNLLIYFQPIAQKKVISMFLFALNVDGILFLGPSETLGSFENEFDPLNRHWNIFRKRKDIRMSPEVSMPLSALSARDSMPPQPESLRRHSADLSLSRTYDSLLESYMPPSILLDKNRQVLHVFGEAIQYIAVPKGRASLDILGMVSGDLKLGLSTGFQRATKEKSSYTLHSIPIETEDGRSLIIDLTVSFLENGNHFLVIFADRRISTKRDSSSVDRINEFDPATESSSRIEDLERELQFSKENLQATIEELETSNEELQATNEELLASNEELQSSNEELQSVNEELFTVNTEYEKKNLELSQVNADMDHLLQSTEIGTIFVDKNLRIRRYTPAIARAFNLLPQDIGRPLEHITYNLEENDSLLADVRAVIKDAGPIEKEIQHRESGWYLMRIYPYLTGTARPSGAVLTLIDISPLKSAEGEMTKHSERLKRSNQDLENFAYIVSHDLQEPLRTVSSYLDLIQKRFADDIDGDANEFIDFAITGAVNMRKRMDDLLAYSRVETRGKDFQLVKVDRVIMAVREKLADQIEQSGTTFHYDLSEVEIWADEKQMIILFESFIENSMKFRGNKAPEIYIWARKHDNDWLFTVKDNGIGINPSDHERIFDVFQQVHSREEYAGSGMGLAISKRIILRHEGRIWTDSQPGQGASFCFYLPSCEGARSDHEIV
ncbi:MAG: chemotaxis protein CheB [Verrucomicrobiota bacterium]